jgi:hypothetical protein
VKAVKVPAAKHSAFGLVDSLKQGELERCCGIYSALNGFRLALANHHGLKARTAWILRGFAFDQLNGRGKLLEALIRGIDFGETLRQARRFAAHLSDERFALSLEQPPKGRGNTTSDLFAWIVESLELDRPVVIRLRGEIEHITVIAGIDAHVVSFVDSGDLTTLPTCDFGIDRGSRHRINRRELFRIGVAPKEARDQRSATSKISETLAPRASAIRNRLSAVTLRSPRSILPMCDLSISERWASASCETPFAFRPKRIAAPSAFKRRTSSSFRFLLDTGTPSILVHP